MSVDLFGVVWYIIAVRGSATERLSLQMSIIVATILPWISKGIYQGFIRLAYHTSFFVFPSLMHVVGVGVQIIVSLILFLYIRQLPDDDYVRWGGLVIIGALVNYVFIAQLFGL